MIRIREFWKYLTASHPRIKNEEEQINSQLLSRLLVILLPVAFLFLWSLSDVYGTSTTVIPNRVVFGILILILVGVYGVNRLGYFQLAVGAIFFLGSVSIFTEAALDKDFTDLAFLLLLMPIASLFRPARSLFFLGLIYIGGSISILFTFPVFQTTIIVQIILPLLILGTILNIIVRLHRDRLESLRNQKIIAGELRYSLAMEAVNDGVWDWDLKTDEIYFSPRWKAMLGYKEGEIGKGTDEWFERVHLQDQVRIQEDLKQHMKGDISRFEGEYRMRHAKGDYLWMHYRGSALRDTNGTAYRMVGSQTDITGRKLAEERLAHNALHDALTGLPNRVLFMDRLTQRLEHTRRHPDQRFAVLFIDLDRFKIINDSLGHAVGDKFLIATARIIQACLRPEDTISRLGGDEFAILLEEVNGIKDAIRVTERIHSRLNSATMIGAVNRSTTASIGITLFNGNYTNPQDMLRDADTAMYRAKALGGGRHQIFDTTMYAKALAILQLEADLKRAVENQEWQIYYQPIVSLASGEIAGVEALIRWMHPQQGIVSPLEFISAAEETGLILTIGEYMLRTACAQVQAWRDADHPKLWASVNISRRQFQEQKLLKIIKQTLNEAGLHSDGLRLEITESVVMKDLAHSIRVINEFNDMGVHVSLDNFGNSYSSLSHLKQLPLKALKIDRSFVQDMELDRKNEAITSAIITLGHTLSLEVIAEGVETEGQLAFLRSQACDEAQGFLFSQPVPDEELGRILKYSKPMQFPLRSTPGSS